ncbi:GNAT family N-acetyltransferase [Paenibacillus oenotherae]|uniref:GNAT family N-acetyltransferase n=1 Tax=Paenibacillus oenotherae TaxID=1435645 RepID=A0ABS7D809_9BACL|nr:GNAT family N-acetyltransferase [Paenibacillus oenotherae]MBW7476073.1 GNAT family N-acetyltransferase [Paenibacillus oenotherae]
MLEYRKAALEDEAFLFELYVETRREEWGALGWSESELLAFLQMQFDMQMRSYAMQYPHIDSQIVYMDELKIGRILISHTEQAVHLIDLTLTERYRRRGIGTELVQNVLKLGEQSGKPVRLHVLQHNPAKGLYERLGFKVTEDRYPYVAMEWQHDQYKWEVES